MAETPPQSPPLEAPPGSPEGSPSLGETIIPRVIEEEMKTAYLNYAMSVIVGRALPDVRDGLKPVHRRILFAMHDMGLQHTKAFKKCARIVGECFVPGTLILTKKGLLPIENVERGDVVYTQQGTQPVRELYEMPAKPLLKVTLENGLSTTVTARQQFKVLTKELGFTWKEAGSLTADDYLVLRAEFPVLPKEVYLGVFNEKKVWLNENIAYLLGQLLSDGWVEKGNKRGYPFRCGWGCTSPTVISRIAAILSEEFGYTAAIEEKQPQRQGNKKQIPFKKLYTVRIHNSLLNQFIVSTFSLQKAVAATKEIPSSIFISPRKVITAFLSGLIDGDGSIHTSRNLINYSSVSFKLIEGLQVLLQQLGFFSQRYTEARGGIQRVLGRTINNPLPYHSLELSSRFSVALAQELYLSEETKKKRVASLHKYASLKVSSFDKIPYAGKIIFEELSRYHLGAGWYAGEEGKKFRAAIRYKAGAKIRYSKDLFNKGLGRTQIQDWGIVSKLKKIGSPLVHFFNHVLDKNLYFLKVKKLEAVPAQKTYDLEVESDHEFLAQGIVSHNCMGKYHPHGDLAVYDSLVRMAQEFSLRYPLVKGQGNFGSLDGDAAAAQRYTEAKLTSLAEELLKDIDKNTVDFADNFDSSLKEPVLLPVVVPHLLVNGSSGIAVGMTTNIPPHNLREICQGVISLIENPHLTVEELMRIIPGPDFPTGAEVVCGNALKYAYSHGRGKVTLKSVTHFEGNKIIVTEIPYQVNKAEMIEQIADLVREKRLPDIKNINDESDREGIRIVIDLRKDADPQVVLNQLYQYSRLKISFGIILLALVDQQPRLLGLKELLQHHIEHRKQVIVRRTTHDLQQAQERVHLLQGLLVALEHLDAVIPGIRNSRTIDDARNFLMTRYSLSEKQAKAILELRLQKLAALEQEQIRNEHRELGEKIASYLELLGSPHKVLQLIQEEARQLQENYGDPRRSRITFQDEEEDDFDREDLIEDQQVVVTFTQSGYLKRMPLMTYRTQHRGGKGIIATGMKEEDATALLYIASTHDHLLCFSDQGQLQWLKVWQLPETSRQAQGKHISHLLQLQPGENITAVIPVKDLTQGHLVMATRQGTIKKTELAEFSHRRRGGIRAVTLEPGDRLVGVLHTDGTQDLILATKLGQANRFSEKDVRSVGRSAYGVRGIRLDAGDEVVGMLVADPDKNILTLTVLGYGKRTPVSEYRLCNRGGKGVTNIKITEKNGAVKAVMLVDGREELMLISEQGVAIRLRCQDISLLGRATQGVRVMRLNSGDRLAAAAKIVIENGVLPEVSEVPREVLPNVPQEGETLEGDAEGEETASPDFLADHREDPTV